MNSFFKIQILPARPLICVMAAFFYAAVLSHGQSVDKDLIQTQIEEGALKKVIGNLEHFLKPGQTISKDDSAYIFKTLGMVYSSLGKLDTAKSTFKRLFSIDSRATIRNTYASHSIIEVFIQAKNEFKKEHGGEILRPKVIVMDPLGPVGHDKYRASIARQFIEELQKLYLFDAMGRSGIKNELEIKNLDQENCVQEACYVNLGKALEGDKIILLYFERVENVTSLTLKYIDVESGKTETILKESSITSIDELILTGLEKCAKELETQNAAWLQFSIEPPNAYLELNGEPTSGDTRIPVMPGKHKVCAAATGYKKRCKQLLVRQNDGITYKLALEPDYAPEPSVEKGAEAPGFQNTPQKGTKASMGTELWILGGLALLGGVLAIVFSL
jgi:hypothetical protein